MENFDPEAILFESIEMCDYEGLKPRKYSGRGMYGKSCLGFNTSNMIGDTAKIIGKAAGLVRDYLESADSEEDLYELTDNLNEVIDLFEQSSYDSMGLDMIVYFPSVKWREEWVERDDEEDEEQS